MRLTTSVVNSTNTNGLTLSGGTLAFDIAAATTEGSGISINPLGILTIGNTYTLISYTGMVFGTEANLQIVNNSRYTFSLSLATPGKMTLTVTGGEAAHLFWFGGTLGAETFWDVQTTENWFDGLAMPSKFFGGDKVKFNDFANSFWGAHALSRVLNWRLRQFSRECR